MVLALEMSSTRGSIACLTPEGGQFNAVFANDRKHSGAFFEQLQKCLREYGPPGQIVVGLGPGSYAGIRIAIATAIGLKSATGASLTGFPSPCAIETDTPEYCVVGDARRQLLHFSRVRARRCVEGPELCTSAELRQRLADVTVPIFASEALIGFDRVQMNFPLALILAQEAKISEQRSDGPLEPIYLNPPHITQPKVCPQVSITK